MSASLLQLNQHDSDGPTHCPEAIWVRAPPPFLGGVWPAHMYLHVWPFVHTTSLKIFVSAGQCICEYVGPGVEEMAHQVKCLPLKHKDKNSDP